jgi:protocatechuate 3,4-dioxygenase beta subunit
MRRLLLFTLAAVLSLAAASSAHYRLGNVEGTVVDSHGNPVADAVVIIQTSYGENPHATHTDAKGNFLFERYPPGLYDLRANVYSIFTPWSRHVAIHANRTTHITMHLPAAVK